MSTFSEQNGNELENVESTSEDQQENELENVESAEINPAIIVDWHYDVLANFVDGVNQGGGPQETLLAQTMEGPLTGSVFMERVMSLLEVVAGGRQGDIILAPNSLNQFGHVLMAVRDVEWHPWMQYFGQSLRAGAFLATMYLVKLEQGKSTGSPMTLHPPMFGSRQLFQ